MAQPSWHPVTPVISDADMRTQYPISGFAGPAPAPAESHGFFQEHKFAIVVSIIVLLVIVVVLFIFLRRDKKKAESEDDPEPSSEPDRRNLAEIRAMRQQARGASSARPEVPTSGSYAPRARAPPAPEPPAEFLETIRRPTAWPRGPQAGFPGARPAQLGPHGWGQSPVVPAQPGARQTLGPETENPPAPDAAGTVRKTATEEPLMSSPTEKASGQSFAEPEAQQRFGEPEGRAGPTRQAPSPPEPRPPQNIMISGPPKSESEIRNSGPTMNSGADEDIVTAFLDT